MKSEKELKKFFAILTNREVKKFIHLTKSYIEVILIPEFKSHRIIFNEFTNEIWKCNNHPTYFPQGKKIGKIKQSTNKKKEKKMKTLTKQEKIAMSTVDIAKAVRKQLKEEFPNCVFSVTSEYYSMGSTLHINLMSSDFKVIQDFDKIPASAYNKLGYGYTQNDIRCRQSENYHQLNQYSLLNNYESDEWCNGVFLTEAGHNLLQKAVRISMQYNYDNSEPQTDYYDVNFALSMEIGKWDKEYQLIK